MTGRRFSAAGLATGVVAIVGALVVLAVSWAPSVAEADGWRLLGHGVGGEPNAVSVVTDPAGLRRIIEDTGLRIDGEVDFAEQVVIAFTPISSTGLLGCQPIGFDGVTQRDGVVYGRYNRPFLRYGCNDDARPYTFLVVMERDDVTADGFFLKLAASSREARWVVLD